MSGAVGIIEYRVERAPPTAYLDQLKAQVEAYRQAPLSGVETGLHAEHYIFNSLAAVPLRTIMR